MFAYYLEEQAETDVFSLDPQSKPFDRQAERIVAKLYLSAKKAAAAKGLKFHLAHLHPHLLRHALGTLYHRQGEDLATIQWQLGHSSPATTELHYVRKSFESMDCAMKRFERRTEFKQAGSKMHSQQMRRRPKDNRRKRRR